MYRKLLRPSYAFTLVAALAAIYFWHSQAAYSQRAQGRDLEVLAKLAQREGLPI